MNDEDRCDRCIVLCRELYLLAQKAHKTNEVSEFDKMEFRRIHNEYANLIGPLEVIADKLPAGVRYYHGEPAPYHDLLTHPLRVDSGSNYGPLDDYVPELLMRIKRRISTESGRGSQQSVSPFTIPVVKRDSTIVAVMMPFSGFDDVDEAIRLACKDSDMKATRSDDIWVAATFVQDIVDLLCRACIVVADLSGRNPNVFYELGIAHAVGAPVVPIVQSLSDVPSDLHHHRVLVYSHTKAGLKKLRKELGERIRVIQNSVTQVAKKAVNPSGGSGVFK